MLKQHGPNIEYGGLAIDFPKQGIRINCPPTRGNIRAEVLTTEDVMDHYPEVFPKVITEEFPPVRNINHEISLKRGADIETLPTYFIPERWAQNMSNWINEKMEPGIIDRKMLYRAAPIFA